MCWWLGVAKNTKKGPTYIPSLQYCQLHTHPPPLPQKSLLMKDEGKGNGNRFVWLVGCLFSQCPFLRGEGQKKKGMTMLCAAPHVSPGDVGRQRSVGSPQVEHRPTNPPPPRPGGGEELLLSSSLFVVYRWRVLFLYRVFFFWTCLSNCTFARDTPIFERLVHPDLFLISQQGLPYY